MLYLHEKAQNDRLRKIKGSEIVDFTDLVGVTIAYGLIKWQKGEVRSKFFLKELLFLWGFLLLFDTVIRYFKKTYSFSIYDYIQMDVEIWLGSILIFSFAYYLSIKVWRKNSNDSVGTDDLNQNKKKLD